PQKKTLDTPKNAQTDNYHIRFDDWVDEVDADDRASFDLEPPNEPSAKPSDQPELAIDQLTQKIVALIEDCQAQTALPIERLYLSVMT
ncbi:hypothetical protein JKG47_23520, partial [Acidithiobacillus sp. MC6.1]|nr:hypothetical protein [Acidithiobacillus sp. MC6.1]